MAHDPKARLIELYRQGQLHEVIRLGRGLPADVAESPFVQNILGVSHARLGEMADAVRHFQKSLEGAPRAPAVHNNLGNALSSMGRPADAVTHFKTALALKPDYAEAHNNLANAYTAMGRAEDTMASLRTALAIEPRYAEAHYNLGIALRQAGHSLEAIEHYRQAILARPDYAAAHENLGILLEELGRHEEAIASLKHAVQANPGDADAGYHLALAVSGSPASFHGYSESWAETFLDLLTRRHTLRPTSFVDHIGLLLKQHPLMRDALRDPGCPGDAEVAVQLCQRLGDVPLLLRIMEVTPLPDLELEGLLRGLRCQLLVRAHGHGGPAAALPFQAALALHCFANEYVFGESEQESALLADLERRLGKNPGGSTPPDWFAIAALASYRPLHRYPWAHHLHPPDGLASVFAAQVSGPAEEARLRDAIPSLGGISDRTSMTVRAQYEENPYPRWIRTHLMPRPKSVADVVSGPLQLRLASPEVSFSAAPEILIAGCGTGENAIAVAARFANSRILAMDLSVSSLAYAVRKTRELGFTNIDYLQGDILDLRMLNRQFDIIESSGVLHHMADPMAGWAVLADCLKPGGLMKIALYSETARQAIVQARALIEQLGFSSATADILRFRRLFIDSLRHEHPELQALTSVKDFYTTSELRDLLFHVQEHRFTLPQIRDSLRQLHLAFAGFELPGNKKASFRAAYPNAEDLYSLDAWHAYETSNPTTFLGMYQFWSQKPLE